MWKQLNFFLSCSSQNFRYNFLNSKEVEKLKTTRAQTESTDIIFKTYKEIPSRESQDTLPLNLLIV